MFAPTIHTSITEIRQGTQAQYYFLSAIDYILFINPLRGFVMGLVLITPTIIQPLRGSEAGINIGDVLLL